MRIRSVVGVLVGSLALLPSAFAEGVASATVDMGSSKIFAAAFCIAVVASFGAMAQAKTAIAALEGIGRNPSASGSLFTPMVVGLALIETLVIYALIISIMILMQK